MTALTDQFRTQSAADSSVALGPNRSEPGQTRHSVGAHGFPTAGPPSQKNSAVRSRSPNPAEWVWHSSNLVVVRMPGKVLVTAPKQRLGRAGCALRSVLEADTFEVSVEAFPDPLGTSRIEFLILRY